MNKWILGSSFIALTAAAVLPSCVEKFGSDCKRSLTCTDASLGSGGAAGSGGKPDGGGAGGATSSGGAVLGSAGLGGAAACKTTCADDTPYCGKEGECVECTGDGHCKGDHCDEGKCVECRDSRDNEDCKAANASRCLGSECVSCERNDDCKHIPGKGVCDEGTCVACLDNRDCKDAGASSCVAKECVPCADDGDGEADDDCSHIEGKHVCDAGTCVECTGKEYGACKVGDGPQRVCNSLEKKCSDELVHDAGGLCQPCISDAHCKLGQLCVQQTYGEAKEPVGYFCHWIQGANVPDAPSVCAAFRLYTEEVDATSIDDQSAVVCGLRVSTCQARNAYGTDCTAGNDTLCGFSPPDDGTCNRKGTTGDVYKCTMPCASDNDCPPGVTCEIGASKSYCKL